MKGSPYLTPKAPPMYPELQRRMNAMGNGEVRRVTALSLVIDVISDSVFVFGASNLFPECDHGK